MRLVDYLLGIPIQLRSPLPGKILAAQINDAASSRFNPFANDVVGGMRFGWILLSVSGGFIDHRGRPILAGRVRDLAEGSQLDLRFGGAWSALSFLIVLLVFVSVAYWQGFADAGLFLLLGVAVVFFGLHVKLLPNDLDELLVFLDAHAEAAPTAITSG